MKRYCPECGNLSFSYDYRLGAHRCLSVDCGISDYENKYNGGLTEKPSNTQKKDNPSSDNLEERVID